MHLLEITDNISLKITPEEELEQAFANGDIVVCCWEPGCTMHRLPHWPAEKWVSCAKRIGYTQYSHGICRWHYHVYAQEIDRIVAKEAAAAAGS